jgi:hypothetical protein
MALEDAVEIRRILEVAAKVCDNSDECLSELGGGSLSVTLRAPLAGVMGLLKTTAKALGEEGRESGGGRPDEKRQ